jgi:hypothetical protein
VDYGVENLMYQVIYHQLEGIAISGTYLLIRSQTSPVQRSTATSSLEVFGFHVRKDMLPRWVILATPVGRKTRKLIKYEWGVGSLHVLNGNGVQSEWGAQSLGS